MKIFGEIKYLQGIFQLSSKKIKTFSNAEAKININKKNAGTEYMPHVKV